MGDLLIRPKGIDGDFHPMDESVGNTTRRCKVPALKNGDAMTLKHLDLGRHQFLKPLLYVFNGAASFGTTLGLLVVSIPLILSLVAIIWMIDWA
jgi:hypothetical protein